MNIFVAVDNVSVLVADDTLNGLVVAAQSPREAAEHIRREITNILRASPAVAPTGPNLTAFGKPVSTGTWTEATLLLTQANAFAKLTPISATNYNYFVATGGTGVTPDIYTVTANTANTLTLGTSLSSAGVDLLAGDITGYFFALLPASSVNNLLAIPKGHYADGLDSGLLYHLQVTAED